MSKSVTVEIGGRAVQLRALSVAQVRRHEQAIRDFDLADPKKWAAQSVALLPLVADCVAEQNPTPPENGWEAFLEENFRQDDLGPVMCALLYASEFKRAEPGESAPAAQ